MLRKHLSTLWIGQTLLFVLGGAGFWLTPRFSLSMITGSLGRSDALSRIAVDAFQLIGPYAIAMGLFTLVALRYPEPRLQRGFARVFALFILQWSVVFWINYSTGRYTPPALVFAVGAIVFGIVDAIVGWGHDPEAELATGHADTRPPEMFMLWLVQGAFLTAEGVLLFLLPGAAVDTLMAMSGIDYALTPFEVDQFRMVAPYYIGLGFLSWFAAWQTDLWVWRSLATAFVATFALHVLTFIWIWDASDYAVLLTLEPLAIAGFAGLNLAFSRRNDITVADDTQRWEPGMRWVDVPAGLVMAAQSWMTRKRASHLYGAGVGGTFEVAERADGTPSSAFFEAGRVFPLQARFANLSFDDDACLDIRGASIRLSDDPHESPLDLSMNTGSFTAPRDILDFTLLALSKAFPVGWVEAALLADPVKYAGAVAGLRRAPSSYADLDYYGQITRTWTDLEGHRWLLRWRLVPEGGPPDRDPIDELDASQPWDRERRAGESRPPTYLRDALRHLADGDGFVMHLEAQFKRWDPEDDDDAWYDATVDWDAARFPWQRIGTCRFDHSLDAATTEKLWFNPQQAPACLGTPRARSLRDPRSLGDAERRVMALGFRIRAYRNRWPRTDKWSWEVR